LKGVGWLGKEKMLLFRERAPAFVVYWYAPESSRKTPTYSLNLARWVSEYQLVPFRPSEGKSVAIERENFDRCGGRFGELPHNRPLNRELQLQEISKFLRSSVPKLER